MARVIQTFPGQDSLVRVITFRTSTTTLKRPVNKVALLHQEDSPPTNRPSSETIAVPPTILILP